MDSRAIIYQLLCWGQTRTLHLLNFPMDPVGKEVLLPCTGEKNKTQDGQLP